MTERSDLEWMELHARALYTHDEHGRIAESNEPRIHRAPAPWFYLGRTRHGSLWRFRGGLAVDAVRELARLAAAEPWAEDVERDPERLDPMLQLLGERVRINSVWRGPAFRFPDPLPDQAEPEKDPGPVVSLAPADATRLEDFPVLVEALAERLPCTAALDGERVVSVCYCASSPASDSPAVEAGVDTLPGFRGRGLAPRVVAAWAEALRAQGWLPLYSTSWENRASRAVARKLRLILVGSDLHVR